SPTERRNNRELSCESGPVGQGRSVCRTGKRRRNHRKDRRLVHKRCWFADGKNRRRAEQIRYLSEVGLTSRVAPSPFNSKMRHGQQLKLAAGQPRTQATRSEWQDSHHSPANPR